MQAGSRIPDFWCGESEAVLVVDINHDLRSKSYEFGRYSHDTLAKPDVCQGKGKKVLSRRLYCRGARSNLDAIFDMMILSK